MAEFRVDWSGRSFSYSEDEIRLAAEVMATADPLTQGVWLQRFEERFRDFTGARNAFATANASNALDLVAVLSDIQEGDEVIVPGHTFCASAVSFARRGAVLRWADIDPSTRVVTPESIEALITPKTKLVVVVHLYGVMADMAAIQAMCDDRGVEVVEDAAQALGAVRDGRHAGTVAQYGVYSFQGQKNLTTLGEGGMLVVRDDASAGRVSGLRHNGLEPIVRPDGDRHYWVPAMSNVAHQFNDEWPFNFCLSEIQCAVGVAALKRLPEMNEVRQVRFERLAQALAPFPELVPQTIPDGSVSAYHLFAVRYDPPNLDVSRDDFIETMAYEYGVKCIVQYYPLYRYDLFVSMGFGEAQCPEVDRFFDNMISLPFHHWMSESDFDYMVDATVATAENLRNRQT